MAAEAFLYDQIALVGVACVLLVTALSQLRLGWKEPQFLRYWLRRIAAAEAVLVTLWSFDPHGVNGIYPPLEYWLIRSAGTSTLVAGTAVFLWGSMSPVFRFNQMRVPTAFTVTQFVIVSAWAVIDFLTSVLRTEYTDKQWPGAVRGFGLAGIAVSQMVAVDLSCMKLHRDVMKVKRSLAAVTSASPQPTLPPRLARLWKIIYALNFAVLVTITFVLIEAVRYARSQERQQLPLRGEDRETYRVRNTIAFLSVCCFLSLGLMMIWKSKPDEPQLVRASSTNSSNLNLTRQVSSTSTRQLSGRGSRPNSPRRAAPDAQDQSASVTLHVETRARTSDA